MSAVEMMAHGEAGSLRLRPARVARRRPRGAGGRPGREGAGRRAEPGARCCRCGWRRRRGSSTSTACPVSTPSRPGPTASGSGRWRGTPTCWRPTTYAACSRWSRWPWPTSRTRPSATGAPRSARSCTPTPRPRCRWCCACSVAPSTWPVRRVAARSRPTTCSSGRWSRRCTTTRSRSSAFFPALAAGAGVAFEEIARRHGDYALCGVAALVTDDAVHAGYLSVCDVPTVVDLTGVADGDLGDAALEHLDPGDDIHASAAYRAQLVRVLTARVVARGEEDGRMSEELHEVRLQVNGVAHDVAVPARRLLSDALRHDVGLTGTHVGCEHGVCGACTVLVDGRPMRSCLMFAVSAVDCEITTVEGLTNADGSLGPVQQAFAECHGLQCGFCTPGFLTTITAGLEENPDADRGRGPRHDRRQPVSLHRLPEHREVGAAGGGAEVVTTKLFGTRVQRVEDQRFLRGNGRYVDDVAVGPNTLHAAVLRSPHAHARVLDVHVDDVLDLEGVHAGLDLRGPGRPLRADGRPAAAADPAPDADPRPHAVRAGQRRGELRRRGDRVRGRRRPLRRRGRRRPDPGRLRGAAARRRHRGRPRGRAPGARGRARQRRRPDGAEQRRRARRPSPPRRTR